MQSSARCAINEHLQGAGKQKQLQGTSLKEVLGHVKYYNFISSHYNQKSHYFTPITFILSCNGKKGNSFILFCLKYILLTLKQPLCFIQQDRLHIHKQDATALLPILLTGHFKKQEEKSCKCFYPQCGERKHQCRTSAKMFPEAIK